MAAGDAASWKQARPGKASQAAKPEQANQPEQQARLQEGADYVIPASNALHPLHSASPSTATAPMATTLGALSSEVLLRIAGNLENARDLTRLRQVNRQLYNVGGDALVSRGGALLQRRTRSG